MTPQPPADPAGRPHDFEGGEDPLSELASLPRFSPASPPYRPGPQPTAGDSRPATQWAAGELALAAVVLAAMAESLEHDPAGFPLLALAAGRLVSPPADAAGSRHPADPAEPAHRAATEILRPVALATLTRAVTWTEPLAADQP